MKQLYFLLAVSFTFPVFSQVGIGTSNPKAQLDIISSSPDNPSILDGLLIPRVTRFPATLPTNDQDGMMVYLVQNTQLHTSGFYYWNHAGRRWESLAGSGGNNFFKPGTTTSPDNIEDPMYRTGNIGIGTQAITAKLQIGMNQATDQNIRKGLHVDNNNPATDQLTTYGIENDNRSATNGTKYGIKNNVGGLGNGIHYGIFTETYQNAGTADIYGIFNRVGRTFGARSNNFGIYSQIGTVQGSGNIYGIYSTALGDHNANVFAGYFAGRLGIGASPQEEYIFPASRGQNGQTLMVDNTGAMNWSYPYRHNYSTTGSATGAFLITDDVFSLRINDQVSHLIIPPANVHRGRIIKLIAWRGTRTKNFLFTGNDDIYDMVNDESIASISGSQIMTIQSAGNRWIVLDIRKAP